MRRITKIVGRAEAPGTASPRWWPATAVLLGGLALLAVAATGCLNDPESPAETVSDAAAAEPIPTLDRDVLLVRLDERIRTARSAGRLAPATADYLLERIADGGVEFTEGSCCGTAGVMAEISCPPGEGSPCAPGSGCGASCGPEDGASARTPRLVIPLGPVPSRNPSTSI